MQMMLEMLLNQHTKHADQQSNDQRDRKINEGQTTHNIVNFYLFFQLLVQSFQQVHKIIWNPEVLVLPLAQWMQCIQRNKGSTLTSAL